jgi:hypothetical protein
MDWACTAGKLGLLLWAAYIVGSISFKVAMRLLT